MVFMVKDALAEYPYLYKQEVKIPIPGVYNSPFERIEFLDGYCFNQYYGSLGKVLDDLEISALNPGKPESRQTLVLYPPLVIRGVLDYKIKHPENIAVLALLRDSIRLGLDVYSLRPGLSEEIRQFRQKILVAAGASMLCEDLKQSRDPVTWNATDPQRSMATAARLTSLTNARDVLFIVLAHGGIAAGMDTYLRYCDFTGSCNSEFYVVRFSRMKKGDKEPRLTAEEIEYLQAQAVRRRIVIFDEDTATWQTMKLAYAYFFNYVFHDVSVLTIANIERGKSENNAVHPDDHKPSIIHLTNNLKTNIIPIQLINNKGFPTLEIINKFNFSN